MMGRKEEQMTLLMFDPREIIPQNHLLRKIDRMVDFDFIYDLVAPTYSDQGRPSIDPVCLIKMLLVGYLYGIKSERRLAEEISLNIAYRWFCGFNVSDKIPDHSSFTKNRKLRWQKCDLFTAIFARVVRKCVEQKLVDGEHMVADGSYIPANVSRGSWTDVQEEVQFSMQSYLDDLDSELEKQAGYKKPPEKSVVRKRTTSTTDTDSGYINHGTKRGIGYLTEMTVDCKYGIITGVDTFPANEKESLIILRHLQKQMTGSGIYFQQIALDRGYDTGAVHRGLELLGITGYIPGINFPNSPQKYGFNYDDKNDRFICPEGQCLTFQRLNCNKSTGKYLRCYQIQNDACLSCPRRASCFDKMGRRRRILASSCYPAFDRGHKRIGSPEYFAMMRRRKIWSEGSFSVLKREHLLSKIRKRGILNASEECLLSALALNLKRMASAIFFAFVQQVLISSHDVLGTQMLLFQQDLFLTQPARNRICDGTPSCADATQNIRKGEKGSISTAPVFMWAMEGEERKEPQTHKAAPR